MDENLNEQQSLVGLSQVAEFGQHEALMNTLVQENVEELYSPNFSLLLDMVCASV